MLELRSRLRPATPAWGVGVCVCLCARSAGTPPIVAGLRGVGGCAWPQASSAPHHSWPGCWGVRVRAPLVPRHSWLGCAVWVCVLGLGFRLRPAPHARAVRVCVRSCARSAHLRHSWLGCAAFVCVLAHGCRLRPATAGWGVGVCLLACALRLNPATPGWGVRCGCVCVGSGLGCAPPLLPGVLECVCACVRAPLLPRHAFLGCAAWVCVLGLRYWLRPATPGWGVGVCACFLCALRWCSTTPGLGARCGWVRWGSGFGCRLPLLAKMFWGVRVRAPLVRRHSWLGCAVWVCALGLGFRLCPATPGWGFLVRVRVCARSACTPSLLAGMFGAGVCAWA